MRFYRLFNGLKENREPIILAVMLLLVLLFAFTAVAFPIDDDPSENDELRVPAPWEATAFALPFISLSSLAALTCLFAAKLHSAEYLDSHIGEKRFADDRTVSSVFTRFGSQVTVLFSAPSLFYSRRLLWDLPRRSTFSGAFPHPFFQRKPFISGGTL